MGGGQSARLRTYLQHSTVWDGVPAEPVQGPLTLINKGPEKWRVCCAVWEAAALGTVFGQFVVEASLEAVGFQEETAGSETLLARWEWEGREQSRSTRERGGRATSCEWKSRPYLSPVVRGAVEPSWGGDPGCSGQAGRAWGQGRE